MKRRRSPVSEDRERQDRIDTRHLLETPEIGVVLEVERSSFFHLIAQLAEAEHLTEHDADIATASEPSSTGIPIEEGRAVDVLKQPLFAHLASDNRPRLLNKAFHREACNQSRRGEDL